MNESEVRFVYLFHGYFNETATQQETKELFQLIQLSANDEQLAIVLKKAWDEMKVSEPLFKADKSYEIFRNILYNEARVLNEGHRVRLISWRKYAAVAAVLLLGGVCLFFALKYRSPRRDYATQQKTKIINDALPGTNKAVLTLADGSKVSLDSAHIGILSKQGRSIVKNTTSGKLIYTLVNNNTDRIPQINTLSTPKGGQYQIELPDGSKAWLNAQSSIKYPTFFKGKNRKVEITGEVYFEVAKNPEIPFIVKANFSEIEVLGTHFNVMAYDNEDAIKTTLQEGSVKIRSGNWSGILKPGEQAVQSRLNGSSIIREVDVDEELAWKNGVFQFTNDNIQSIMRKICRWYDVDVVYEGEVPVKQYSGRISRAVKVSEFLNMLKYTGVNSVIKAKTIYLIN